ncbi:hypothetical protein [Dielma fastidiosa]|uniref:hypothetical protein n=1 Tax=Dielma fastidiosa TaxID=1034346 RepID=UPI0023F2CC36|nr:hypothetical protein [Dielma fastidiosa]
MVIKLNIWKNQKEIDKTYMIDSFDIMWGTIEDLIEVIDLNEFANQLTSNGMSNTALINMVASALTNSRDLINNTLKDIFVGLTDEELKRVKLKELINVALQLITGSVNIMQDLGKNSKNVQGRQ